MKTWIDSDLQLRRQMIANIADEQNLQSVTIEKDWWVTMTLKALFETSCCEYHVHYVDYSRLLPENISFLPPDSLLQD